MPIYEFRCAPQGHQFEAFVMTSQEAVQCPSCGSQQLERLMSSFAAPSGAVAPAAGAPAPAAPKGGCGAACGCH